MIELVAAFCFLPFIFFCWFMELRQKKNDQKLKGHVESVFYTDDEGLPEKDPYLEYGEAEVEVLLS